MNQLYRKWYMAKDIMNLLGVSSGQLFHWGRTWGLIKPDVKARGRAFKDKYSFRNLLDIALIKELNDLGFEPSKIKEIMAPFRKGPWMKKGMKGTILDYYKAGREDSEEYIDEKETWEPYPGYDKDALYILIEKKADGDYSLGLPGNIKHIFGLVANSMKILQSDAPKTNIIINLSAIVKELEEKTGERL